MYKIMIVEDDLTLANNVKSFLENFDLQVFICKDFDNIGSQVKEVDPDLVLLDLNLPTYNGFFWCKEIRSFSKLPIIFISGRDGDLEQIYAIENGADDYIVKPFTLDLLIAKIRANLRRSYGEYSILEKEKLLEVGNVKLNLDSFTLENSGLQVQLTKKEIQLLSIFFENQNKVISRDLLLKSIWDDENFVEENTLNVNITRIRKKLEEIDAHLKIESIRGAGYKMEVAD